MPRESAVRSVDPSATPRARRTPRPRATATTTTPRKPTVRKRKAAPPPDPDLLPDVPTAAEVVSTPTTLADKPVDTTSLGATNKTAKLRRAPTSIPDDVASVRTSRKRAKLQVAIGAGVFVVMMAASVAIGTSDAGMINVREKIEARNAQVAAGEIPYGEEQGTEALTSLPVQNAAPALPNGGLRGAGKSKPPPPPPAPEPTASTTDEGTATSTDETNESDSDSDETSDSVEGEGSGDEVDSTTSDEASNETSDTEAVE